MSHEFPMVELKELRENTQYRSASGAQKIIYPLTDGRLTYAVKIVREVNESSEEPQDQTQMAYDEYTAYQLLRKSSLRPYVPEPCFLVKNRVSKVIGLAVEWREGSLLADLVGQHPLRSDQIDAFEQALLDLNMTINLDCIGEANIGVASWEEPGLWLAECWLHSQSLDDFQRTIRRCMNSFRKEYT
ncbi:MAG: hypothetical protein HZA34_02095 [Candidatus Pacebacteria bacterium]|nr:hypothetical protein [Candidatus Paceibacterota bacterium]